MNISERVYVLRRVRGLTRQQLAKMAGVTLSTVSRIESGEVSPSIGLSRELLDILGESLVSVPTVGNDAILAARKTLDPDLPVELTERARQWINRWERGGAFSGSESTIFATVLRLAAGVSSLRGRLGAIDVEPDRWWAIAELLDDSGVSWAMTGSAAANLYVGSAADIWPVFYVSDIEMATGRTGLRAMRDGELGDRATLIPFDGVSELARAPEPNGVVLAAREQIVLDCLAGIGRMPEQADAMIASMNGIAA